MVIIVICITIICQSYLFFIRFCGSMWTEASTRIYRQFRISTFEAANTQKTLIVIQKVLQQLR